jgi:hypothetical protein
MTDITSGGVFFMQRGCEFFPHITAHFRGGGAGEGSLLVTCTVGKEESAGWGLDGDRRQLLVVPFYLKKILFAC